MPLPKPKKGEKENEFISRCMSELNDEYPDEDQRAAICHSQWEDKDKEGSSSRVLDIILKSHWAILPETLQTIHDVVLNHAELLNATPQSFEKRTCAMDHLALREWVQVDANHDVFVSDGVAYIPMIGVLAKRMNLFMSISGGTSTQLLRRDISFAMEHEDVKSILLDVDSPGGSVDGTMALADAVFDARGKKPVIAFANGQMTSAAYWIGSAADKIVATADSIIGSIGVITTHYDYSEADKKEGIKRTIITSGKYKAIGNDAGPLSKGDREIIQGELDYYYTLFVDAVAKNRGTSSEKVLSDMADGRIFIGKQALDRGMVDEIGSFETAFNVALASGGAAKPKTISVEGGNKDMKLADLKKDDPEGYALLISEVQGAVKVEFVRDMDALRAQLAEKEAINVAQGKQILALEKDKILREEKDREKDANAIWDRELAASDIPVRLHDKVRNQVSYASFVTKEGVFDKTGFTAAVQKEIVDGWPASSVQGLGVMRKDPASSDSETKQEKEDEALANELFDLSPQGKAARKAA